MTGKTMLIVNPVSGKGRVKTFLLQLISVLGAGGNAVSVFVTERRGHAAEFAEKYGAAFDRVICTGGDGTVSEVISGLMALPKEMRPQLGYVPLGTTNDMATTLRLPKTPEKVVETILTSPGRYIDIGRFGSEYFAYVAAFGAFTEISYTTPQSAKNSLGYLAYLLEALGKISNIQSVKTHVEYDGSSLDGEYIFGAVTNSASVAKVFKLDSQDVSLNDGIFEILLIKTPRNAAALSECISNVLAQKYNTEQVTLLRAKNISFSFDHDVAWTRDGENGGLLSNVNIENCHSAINFLY